jgi:poly(A) polymerase
MNLNGNNLNDKAEWLGDPDVQALFAALNADGGQARVVGGAVRNALMNAPPGDIDFATTSLPDKTMALVEAAGFKAVPTGFAHGTITAVKNSRAYEITTLRRDMATDGRHAEVAFGTDWAVDAQRRDFTINALSCDVSGVVHDYCDGLADLESRTIRFIGNPETRIAEDYLRSLRFYRFFAYYGAGRPDAAGIRATAKLKSGLDRLSAERVWAELKKLLSAPDPSRALLWMRQAGVLSAVLPESHLWGIDAVPGLISTEAALHWPAEPLLRLMAIVPADMPRMDAMASRLKLSKVERERILGHAAAEPVTAGLTEPLLAKRLYWNGVEGTIDRLKLALAAARAKAIASDDAMMKAGRLNRLLSFAQNWQRPVFPVSGKDLKDKGFAEGAALGQALTAMETRWVDSGFQLQRDALLD